MHGGYFGRNTNRPNKLHFKDEHLRDILLSFIRYLDKNLNFDAITSMVHLWDVAVVYKINDEIV